MTFTSRLGPSLHNDFEGPNLRMYANSISVLVKVENLILCGVTGETEFNTDFGRAVNSSTKSSDLSA